MAAPVSLINADRLWARLMMLAEIGATPAGGVNRQALSDGEIEAWHLMIRWAHDAGLAAATDAAGNLFVTLAGHDRAHRRSCSAVISTLSPRAENSTGPRVCWRRSKRWYRWRSKASRRCAMSSLSPG
jgi:acetylornithine deacetylase/succinyl-diaminopimelate desuccinylase-like protein